MQLILAGNVSIASKLTTIIIIITSITLIDLKHICELLIQLCQENWDLSRPLASIKIFLTSFSSFTIYCYSNEQVDVLYDSGWTYTVLYDQHTAIPLCFHSAVDLSFNGLSFSFSLPESLESATSLSWFDLTYNIKHVFWAIFSISWLLDASKQNPLL